MSATPTGIGFDRLPGAVRVLLDEAANNVAAAAGGLADLADLAEDPARDRELRGVLDQQVSDGRRIGHDLRRELAARRTIGPARGDLLLFAQSIEVVLDSIDDATHHLTLFADAVRPEDLRRLAGVVRDIVRVTGQVARRVDERPADIALLGERADELRAEARGAVREIRTRAVAVPDDPLIVLRRDLLLGRLEAPIDASMQTVRRAALLATNKT